MNKFSRAKLTMYNFDYNSFIAGRLYENVYWKIFEDNNYHKKLKYSTYQSIVIEQNTIKTIKPNTDVIAKYVISRLKNELALYNYKLQCKVSESEIHVTNSGKGVAFNLLLVLTNTDTNCINNFPFNY